MKIKLIKGWNGHPPGALIEPRLDGVARTLIQRGYAVEQAARPDKQKPKQK